MHVVVVVVMVDHHHQGIHLELAWVVVDHHHLDILEVCILPCGEEEAVVHHLLDIQCLLPLMVMKKVEVVVVEENDNEKILVDQVLRVEEEDKIHPPG